MRGSSPRQKEQKGSSGSSSGRPTSPGPLAGGSYTKSTSQSAQRVNPGRYSALHCGQNMAKRESTTRTNHSPLKNCLATRCVLPLCFHSLVESFESGRKLFYLNALFDTWQYTYFIIACVVS